MRRLFASALLLAFVSVLAPAQSLDDIRSLWSGTDFSDTPALERRFADFAGLLTFTPDSASVSRAYDVLFAAIGSDRTALGAVAAVADKYLYTRESPVLNEEFYIPFLRRYMSSGLISEADSLRADALLADLLLNRVSTPIADIPLTLLSSGESASLRSLVNPEGQTMVIFYDIQCRHCADALAGLSASARLNSAIASGRLRVIAVYAGEPSPAWSAYAAALNPAWLSAAAPDADSFFAFPWFPSLYILDIEKNILSKNVNPQIFK